MLRTTRHRLLVAGLAAGALTIPTLAAPAGASAATCIKPLAGPGEDWLIERDGSHAKATYLAQGSNFDADHGRLTVEGVAYPKVPDNDNACVVTDTSITYPTKSLGGVNVRRKVMAVDGQVRRLDTFTNPGNATKFIDVDLRLSVLPGQHAVESSSGDIPITAADHWSVHKNTPGQSNPFLQWGDATAGEQPTVVSDDPNSPTAWKLKIDSMPDANLRYVNLAVPPNTAVRLLHVNGTALGAAASRALAVDGASAFKGVSVGEAKQVVNWGNDPDGDGVGKPVDACPSVKGNQPNGCFVKQGELAPADPAPGDDAPQPPAPPAEDPGTQPQPQPEPQQPAAADTSGPRISLTGVVRRARRARLHHHGIKPTVGCDEACTFSLRITGRLKGRRNETTLVKTRSLRLDGKPITMRLHLGNRAARLVSARGVFVRITATDDAGNRSTSIRRIRVRN